MAINPVKNKTSTKAKHLSILIARDGLSFCVSANPKVVEIFYERHFSSPQTPEELLGEIQSFFNYSFETDTEAINTISVFYANPLYALVPRPFFDENQLGDYLKFNTKLLPTDELTFDELTQIEANLVYIPYTNINNYLFEKFGEFTYQHAVSHFVDQCKTRVEKDGTVVFANVFSTHFDLCIFQKDRLLLSNSYDYFSPEDFVYYVLFAIEQLNLDTETLKLKLCGDLNRNSKIFELLYTYIRDVSFIKSDHRLTIEDKALKKMEPHKNHFLLKTIACG